MFYFGLCWISCFVCVLAFVSPSLRLPNAFLSLSLARSSAFNVVSLYLSFSLFLSLCSFFFVFCLLCTLLRAYRLADEPTTVLGKVSSISVARVIDCSIVRTCLQIGFSVCSQVVPWCVAHDAQVFRCSTMHCCLKIGCISKTWREPGTDWV